MKALDGGEWSTSRPDRFTPGTNSGTNLIGSWEGPRTGLHVTEEKESFLPLPGYEPQTALPGFSKITMLNKFCAGEDMKLEKNLKTPVTQTSMHYQYHMCQLKT
jgi:hypothetical protein